MKKLEMAFALLMMSSSLLADRVWLDETEISRMKAGWGESKPCESVDVRDNSWRRPFEADRKRAKTAASNGDCDGCE